MYAAEPQLRLVRHWQGNTLPAYAWTCLVTTHWICHATTHMILRAVFSAGGHVSLEQPTNAMSLESFVQSFVSEIQASLVVIPACSVGQDLAKSWLFATSFQGLQSLAAKCTHGNTHVQVAGIQDAQGHFLSQRTAEYPAGLASKFCLQVAPLFNDGLKQVAWPGNPQSPSVARFCTLGFALQCIPRKLRSAPPFGAQDGGGIYSLPDWSYAPRYAADQLQALRKEWQQWLLEKHVPARLSQHVSAHLETPLFTEAETAWLRDSFCRFSATLSPSSGWDFEIAQGQPYCLTALERLSTILGDKDTSLFPALQQGVPTGFDDDIPRSHTLRPRRDADPDEGHDLLVCEGNWQGAESDPALLQELIEEEIASGYLEEMPSLEAAYARWGQDRVAVGKVNIVKAPGRSPAWSSTTQSAIRTKTASYRNNSACPAFRTLSPLSHFARTLKRWVVFRLMSKEHTKLQEYGNEIAGCSACANKNDYCSIECALSGPAFHPTGSRG